MGNAEIITYFDRLAPQWDADMIRNERIISRILDAAGIVAGVSVLDVACGTGVLIPDYLARGASRVVGVDISPEMIRLAREKFAHEARVSFLAADILETAFETPFDRCMVYNAFPHFPAPAALIERLSGALTRTGRLTVAHGMSRARIDAHHAGGASAVSVRLLPETELAALFRPYFDVDTVVSDDDMYLVSGVKRRGC